MIEFVLKMPLSLNQPTNCERFNGSQTQVAIIRVLVTEPRHSNNCTDELWEGKHRLIYRTVQIVVLASFFGFARLLHWTGLHWVYWCVLYRLVENACTLTVHRICCFMYVSYVPLSCWSNIYTSSYDMLHAWVLCRATVFLCHVHCALWSCVCARVISGLL